MSSTGPSLSTGCPWTQHLTPNSSSETAQCVPYMTAPLRWQIHKTLLIIGLKPHESEKACVFICIVSIRVIKPWFQCNAIVSMRKITHKWMKTLVSKTESLPQMIRLVDKRPKSMVTDCEAETSQVLYYCELQFLELEKYWWGSRLALKLSLVNTKLEWNQFTQQFTVSNEWIKQSYRKDWAHWTFSMQ